MGLADYILYRVAKNWPSPVAFLQKQFKAEPGSDDFHMAYAQHQFNLKVRSGLMRHVTGRDVLEIGTGHGGIACFMAVVGANRVVATDLNTEDLEFGRRFVEIVAARLSPDCKLRVEFIEMNATQLTFPDASFDLVLADNVFEHFDDPEAVMKECHRVLRPGGGVLVPNVGSIYSKHGLHLKQGLKVPWANLIFSERTIIRAMQRLAQDNPLLLKLYPGLLNNPQRVRDLRRYRDLNDITFKKFKRIAKECGFEVQQFSPHAPVIGRIVGKIPILRKSILADIFSVGAMAFLRRRPTDKD